MRRSFVGVKEQGRGQRGMMTLRFVVISSEARTSIPGALFAPKSLSLGLASKGEERFLTSLRSVRNDRKRGVSMCLKRKE